MATALTDKRCKPCEGGTQPLEPAEVEKLLPQTPEWEVADDEVRKIGRTWKFKDFAEAMVFINEVAQIAEEENHHPNISISYAKVTLTLWTHAIGGLSENDFIVAAKVDALPLAKNQERDS